jgi:Tol biopolymer transport system component
MQFDSEAITVVGRFETGVVFYDIDPSGFIDDGPMSWTILPQSGERFDVEFDFPLAPMTTDDNAPGTATLLASSSESTGSIYQLLDLSSCTAAGCEMTQLRRLPAWSPDGRYTLATLAASAPPFHVLLGNSTATAMREIDEGTLPFWLDETTFGYLTHRDGRSVIVTANVDNPQFSQTLLSASDLLPALIQDKRPETVAIRRIAAAPPDGRWLFIEAITADLHNQYIFAFDRETGEITLRLHLDDQDRFIAFRFSPDGRYWTLTTHARNDLIGTNWALYLHDIAHNETKKLAFRPVPFAEYSYDWSADGRWLLKADSGVIQLINPDDDYFKLIFYDGAQCTSAVWLPTSP